MVNKEFACQAGDAGLIPGSGRAPGGGNGHPLQYFCLGNSKDRETWKAKQIRGCMGWQNSRIQLSD